MKKTLMAIAATMLLASASTTFAASGTLADLFKDKNSAEVSIGGTQTSDGNHDDNGSSEGNEHSGNGSDGSGSDGGHGDSGNDGGHSGGGESDGDN